MLLGYLSHLWLCAVEMSSSTGDHERAEPQGEAYIRWHTPDERHATWVKFGWDTEEGGSEEMVWQALELLAGRSLR